MNEQPAMNNPESLGKEDTYFLLSELRRAPHLTQRELSLRLNISLGKTNYLIKELIKKGLVKVKSFSHHSGKMKKVRYILTQKGFKETMRLAYYYLKIKETEYFNFKKEVEYISSRGKI